MTNAKARLQRLETEESVPVEEAPALADWKAQMEVLQAQVNSLPRRTGPRQFTALP